MGLVLQEKYNCKMVAKKENFIYIDTGAMYRSVAFYCIKNHIDLNDEQAVEQAISNIQIRLTADNKVYLMMKMLAFKLEQMKFHLELAVFLNIKR